MENSVIKNLELNYSQVRSVVENWYLSIPISPHQNGAPKNGNKPSRTLTLTSLKSELL